MKFRRSGTLTHFQKLLNHLSGPPPFSERNACVKPKVSITQLPIKTSTSTATAHHVNGSPAKGFTDSNCQY